MNTEEHVEPVLNYSSETFKFYKARLVGLGLVTMLLLTFSGLVSWLSGNDSVNLSVLSQTDQSAASFGSKKTPLTANQPLPTEIPVLIKGSKFELLYRVLRCNWKIVVAVSLAVILLAAIGIGLGVIFEQARIDREFAEQTRIKDEEDQARIKEDADSVKVGEEQEQPAETGSTLYSIVFGVAVNLFLTVVVFCVISKRDNDILSSFILPGLLSFLLLQSLPVALLFVLLAIHRNAVDRKCKYSTSNIPRKHLFTVLIAICRGLMFVLTVLATPLLVFLAWRRREPKFKILNKLFSTPLGHQLTF